MWCVIVGIIVLDLVLIAFGFKILTKRIEQLNLVKENYPVYLRQNEKGYLEYSVDHNLWTPLLRFNPAVTYEDICGNYIGPGLLYIKVDKENADKLSVEFATANKCWENNRKAINEYGEAIKLWLQYK